MHELSLCHSILGIAERGRGDRSVTIVHLQVGQLRQVVPETLRYCWTLVAAGTGLDGSVLEIDHVPVTLECRACDATTTVEHHLVLTCAGCGSGDIQVVTGEEFVLTSLDLAPLPDPLLAPDPLPSPDKEYADG